MGKQKTLVPWFQRGDIGGMTYSITNNIVNYLIVIATLSGVLEWPDKIVYGYVIPGMSIGLLCSGVYYAYMGRRLSKKEGRADVTALPSGVSTPAMFVMLYGVIMPLHYALNDAELAWSAAVAACFIGGAVEFLGGFIGPWMKKKLPRAALLGTVAGIGFIWMATQGVFDAVSYTHLSFAAHTTRKNWKAEIHVRFCISIRHWLLSRLVCFRCLKSSMKALRRCLQN